MKGRGQLLLLGLGLALFAWFVHRAGPAEIAGVFRQFGWTLPLALLPFLLVYCIDALAWRFAFPPHLRGGRPSFLALLRIRWAGESVNNLVPTGYVGGEAVKAWLLAKRGVSLPTATASVVVSKTLQVAAQVVFIALGAALAVSRLPAESPARQSFALVAALALVVVLLLFWVQAHGFFKLATSVSRRLRLTWVQKRELELRALDQQIVGFYRQHPRSSLACAGTYLLGWIGDALEVYVVSHLLGFPMDYPTALAIESFISVAKALGIFVPGALGVQESGVWLLFSLFGFTEPQALAYAILRRGRDVIYAGIGVAILYAEGGSLRRLNPSPPPGPAPTPL